MWGGIHYLWVWISSDWEYLNTLPVVPKKFKGLPVQYNYWKSGALNLILCRDVHTWLLKYHHNSSDWLLSTNINRRELEGKFSVAVPMLKLRITVSEGDHLNFQLKICWNLITDLFRLKQFAQFWRCLKQESINLIAFVKSFKSTKHPGNLVQLNAGLLP